jgi:hypothetical protein
MTTCPDSVRGTICGMRACPRVAVLALAALLATPALAQDKAGKRDDLDVTMQIIVEPNAKLPDEVVRQIPLPTSRANPPGDSAQKSQTKAEAEKAQARAKEAEQLGREAAETARERAHEANQQREEARNSNAKDRDKDTGPPDRPNPPRRN